MRSILSHQLAGPFRRPSVVEHARLHHFLVDFNLDLASVVVREGCWSGDAAAHAYSLDKAMKMYARIRTFDQVAAMLRE
jgi:hypothetical protein